MLSSKLVLEVDTTSIDAALAKINDLEAALLRANEAASAVALEGVPARAGDAANSYWTEAVKSGAITSVCGELASIAIDPLESAIESTTRMMRDELEASGATPDQFPIGAYARLDAHLDELLRMQIDQLTK